MFWRQKFHHSLLLFQLVYTGQSSFASTGGWEQNFAIGNFLHFWVKSLGEYTVFLHLSLQVDDNWQTPCNPTFSNHPSCPQLLSSDAALLRLRINRTRSGLCWLKSSRMVSPLLAVTVVLKRAAGSSLEPAFPQILHSCLTCPTPVSTRHSTRHHYHSHRIPFPPINPTMPSIFFLLASKRTLYHHH